MELRSTRDPYDGEHAGGERYPDRGSDHFVARRYARELHLDEVEVILDRIEIAAGLTGLAEGKGAFGIVWNAPTLRGFSTSSPER
jgi:hypothetical protein